MSLRNEWEGPQTNRGGIFGEVGMGAVRVALLFGSAAVALALILTPLIESQTERIAYSPPAGVDMMATGATGPRGAGSYTIRRSVLQSSANAVCIIRQNGVRTGDC